MMYFKKYYILLFSLFSLNTLAITGNDLVPPKDLPSGVCQIHLKNYRYKSWFSRRKPILAKSPCTGSFIHENFILTARHCLQEDQMFGYSPPKLKKMKAKNIDIFCAKTQKLYRDIEIKKIHFPKSSFHRFHWDLDYKDIILVQLKKFKDHSITPLAINTFKLTSSTQQLKVLGYGKTDTKENGILNQVEPFLIFNDFYSQTMYNRSLTGIYKGSIVNHFKLLNIEGLKEHIQEYDVLGDLYSGLLEASTYDQSGHPLLYVQSNFLNTIDQKIDNTPIKPGDSGGPVLNSKNEIIAIHSFATIGKQSGNDKRLAGFSTFLTKDLIHWIKKIVSR